MRTYLQRNGLVISLAAIFIFSCIAATHADAASKRELWSCYDVGASGYIQTSTIADAFLKKYGTRVRLTPSGTSVGRIMPVINKQVKYGFLASLSQAGFRYIGEFHAEITAKILNGAKPGELPQLFEEPPKIALNLKTAETIGFDPPVDIMLAADEIYKDIESPPAN